MFNGEQTAEQEYALERAKRLELSNQYRQVLKAWIGYIAQSELLLALYKPYAGQFKLVQHFANDIAAARQHTVKLGEHIAKLEAK